MNDRFDLGTMAIDRQYAELEDNSPELDTPKSAAGVRTAHIPTHLPGCLQHMSAHPNPASLLVFTESLDRPLTRGRWRTTLVKAQESVGPGLSLPRPAPHRRPLRRPLEPAPRS